MSDLYIYSDKDLVLESRERRIELPAHYRCKVHADALLSLWGNDRVYAVVCDKDGNDLIEPVKLSCDFGRLFSLLIDCGSIKRDNGTENAEEDLDG